MGHAHLKNNTWVEDNGLDITDQPFADRSESRFATQIEVLASHRCHLPPGWHRIFDDMIHALKAVNCSKRDGIEFSEPAVGRGCLHIQVYYATTDRAVRGIVQKLSARSECTCEMCGRSYGTTFRFGSEQTLCATCHVRAELKQNVELWLGESYKASIYRSTPVLEFDRLPLAIQKLVPRHKVRNLYVTSLKHPISYVTPSDVTAQMSKLKMIQQYLEQPVMP